LLSVDVVVTWRRIVEEGGERKKFFYCVGFILDREVIYRIIKRATNKGINISACRRCGMYCTMHCLPPVHPSPPVWNCPWAGRNFLMWHGLGMVHNHHMVIHG
jgi:hypothetical protein